MNELVLADQEELTYISSVQKQNVVEKTCWKRWTIGTNGKRESRKSMLAARLDDDEEPMTVSN